MGLWVRNNDDNDDDDNNGVRYDGIEIAMLDI